LFDKQNGDFLNHSV